MELYCIVVPICARYMLLLLKCKLCSNFAFADNHLRGDEAGGSTSMEKQKAEEERWE